MPIDYNMAFAITDFETHASLYNMYTAFANLYISQDLPRVITIYRSHVDLRWHFSSIPYIVIREITSHRASETFMVISTRNHISLVFCFHLSIPIYIKAHRKPNVFRLDLPLHIS